ncbi:MAG: bifunctional methylenetetrahydrofolate dehydrogenase/methenyltetrahydrofolate cyclohydrolase FolD [Epulopiscium sp.]|nr:bifunctional methylenetetrahydrofolate dehydrogenase/methenyltetrahydrofolate cyclohydrolase FolD [Candidatus Epulonipiscium sp.]
MSQLIDGKQIAKDIKDELKKEIQQLKNSNIEPTLAVILVGEDPASQIYVSNKKKACAYVGIRSLSYELPGDVTEEELLGVIEELNQREDVHGILVQLPLPAQIEEEKILMAIHPEKDVDGFHPINVGALSIGKEGFQPCTAAGIIELLKRSQITIEGKHCVVVGRSNIVGKPVSLLLIQENGTVTICHSKTKNLKDICRQADILVAAVGKANMITSDMVKDGAVLIDVGVNRLENGKVCGDIDFENCKEKASAITPVPGGVGPMTIAMLLYNCIQSAKNGEELFV